jgi:hypothetical protein
MGKGGARSNSGPPPDPNALRRDREGEWLTLPANGRQGDPPRFPLLDPTLREWDLWTEMWAKPQAAVWEKRGLEHEVALFVRRLAEAESPAAPATIGTLVRQMMDSLGLTTPGMRNNRWQIAEDELGAARDAQGPKRDVPSSRARFTRVASE